MDLGIIIADATHDLTGHFLFSIGSNVANGVERLLVAGVQRGGRGVPTGTLFVEFRGGGFLCGTPLESLGDCFPQPVPSDVPWLFGGSY